MLQRADLPMNRLPALLALFITSRAAGGCKAVLGSAARAPHLHSRWTAAVRTGYCSCWTGPLPGLAGSAADTGCSHMRLLEASVKLLMNLGQGGPERCQAIIAAGGGPTLARSLRSQQWQAAELGVQALQLLHHQGDGRLALAAHAPGGAWPALLHAVIEDLTRSQLGAEVQQAAAAVLRRLRRGAYCGQGERADAASNEARHLAAAAPSATQTAPIAQPPRPPRTCAAPGCSVTRGLRLCGGCGSVRYCGEACSRAHWRAHRAECRRLQAEQADEAAAAAGSEEAARPS